MTDPDKITTISLSQGTKDRILTFGKMGDTYEDVLNTLMDFHENFFEASKK